MGWKSKLKLSDGDEVKFIGKFDAGHMGQKERYKYEIINAKGELVGTVKYVEYTSTTVPYNETYTLQQYDINGNEIVFERW